ncbi:YcaO-like family protein [Ramlibacter ginsenosidimutans]|uniref:YcaO-like family protein n=1 Tax=Ramlibacter ginsenosidimutans TaxID=502333 RepID=A0A934WKR0_9BURK|nr:YcaO-like family protein [Ramlibacter ginsenosidimutans]MBK6004880.1 YcaO-like family protein [Ramlibacter ginsenosidimutans]
MRTAPVPRSAEFPLAFGRWLVRRDGLVCELPRRELRVTAPAGLLARVLELCDGRLRWKEVAAQLGRQWEPVAIEGFLSDLCAEGAIVEAGEALANWSELGDLPGLHVPITATGELARLPALAHARLRPGRGHAAHSPASRALAQLLAGRESVRTFADAPFSSAVLAAILWAAHGVSRRAAGDAVRWHRTIASGGNMHSVRWFVFVLRALPGEGESPPLAAGVHEARFHEEGGASFEAQPGAWQDAWRLLGDPRALQFASALVVPVHDVAVPARKYGDRATIFAHVEAGQALQNAQLMAAAQGVAMVVRGDTAARPALAALAQTLRAPDDAPAVRRPLWLVMPSLLLGMPPDPRDLDAAAGATALRIGRAPLPRAHEAAPTFAFTASWIEQPGTAGLGRAADPVLAMRKAEAEAWERLGWRTLGACRRAALVDVPGALDPQAFCAYSQRQYAQPGFGLQAFSPARDYLWRAGVHADSGRAVHLPAECLHPAASLPQWARQQACANASTSGVAAWPDAEGALARGTLELLERDAFLRHWLSGQSAPALTITSLPEAAQRRIADLQSAGFRVSVAAIGAGWVPICSVFLQRMNPPLTAITAAADFCAEAALHKALDEAEGRAAHAGAHRPAAMPASQVRSPSDVHRYYQAARSFRRSDFYAATAAALAWAGAFTGACKHWPALCSLLAARGHELHAFDLTPAGAALDQGRTPIRVVRAVVTGLIPIWFQYGMQPAGLAAFRQAAAQGRRRGPSFFLHPFT